LRIDGIPPGAYRIVVKQGRWYHAGVTVGASVSEAVVAPGSLTETEVRLEDREVEGAHLAILVAQTPPWEWERAAYRLVGADAKTEHLSLDAPDLRPTRSGILIRAPAGDLPIGLYDLEIAMPGFTWTQRLELAAASRTPDVYVPGAAAVKVNVRRLDAGPLPSPLHVHWRTVSDVGGVARGSAIIDEGTGQAVLSVPTGEFSMQISADGYLDAQHGPYRLIEGHSTTCDVTLVAAGAILLHIHESDSLLDRKVVWLGLERQDPLARETLSWSEVAEGEPIDIPGLAAGRYLLRFTVEGYETQQIEDVIVEAGQTRNLQVRVRQ
jgi:hypothetical protein